MSVGFGSVGVSSVDKASAVQFKVALGKTMAGQWASGLDSAAKNGDAEASLTEMMIMLEQLIIQLQTASSTTSDGERSFDHWRD